MHPANRPRIEPLAFGIAVTAGLVASLLTGDCAQRARAEEAPERIEAERIEGETTMWIIDPEQPAIAVPAAWATDAPAVIQCESRWDPAAISPTGDYGLLQLNKRWQEGRANRMGYEWSQMLEPEPNIRVAIAIWEEQSWRPWTCATKLGIR